MWWRHNISGGPITHEIKSMIPPLPKYKKKMGGPWTRFWATLIFPKAYFCSFNVITAIVRTRGFLTSTPPYGLMKCYNGLEMLWNRYLKYKESITCEKTAFLCIMGCAYAQNARAHVRARKIFKCLKWPETYSRLVVWWFWAFLNFNARVRARHDLWMTFGDMTWWPTTWS